MEWLAALRSETDLIVPELVKARDGTVVAGAGVPESRR
jgi:hypothetical protein